MKKSTKWGLGIIICVVLIMFISILLESEEQKAAKQQEKEKLSKVEQKIKAIPNDESFAKYIKISEVEKYIKIPEIEDDGSTYRIWMYLLFEPRSYSQVQTWTDVVCESSKRILDNDGVVRDIEVWAIRPVRTSWEGEGGVIVYGRTFYNHHTNKFEFKKTEELKLKEEKEGA